MKKSKLPIILLASICLLLTNKMINAQPPVPGDIIWHTFQGGPSTTADKAFGIDKDSDGNIYIVGHSESDWDMTGQPGATLVNQHTNVVHDNRKFDVYVAKFNPYGKLVWYTFIGDAGSNDSGWDIAVDSDGEVFVVGQTVNWYLYYPNNPNSWSEENRAFVAKFDNDGNFLWKHSMGRTDSPNDNAGAVDIDASGNVYVMGSNSLGWNWDDGAGDITGPLNPFKDAYGANYFVAKFNNDLDYQWHTFIGPHAVAGNSGGGNMDLVVKGSDIYLTGASYFRMTIPGVTPVIDHDEGNIDGDRVCQEGFVLKMNTSGNILWYTYLGYDYNAAPLNSGDGAWTNGIDADMSGNIYITGSSPRNFRYPTTSPIHAKHAFGDPDCFIMKINSNKNTTECIEWNTFWSYAQNDRGEDLKLDPYGNVFIGANGLSSSNVIFMLDNDGNMQWLKGLWDYPGTGNLKSIVLGSSGGLFFTGYGGNWPTSLGDPIHAHMMYDDAYLAKMHINQIPVITIENNPLIVNQGDIALNSGEVYDPEGETDIFINSDFGIMENNGDGTWSWSSETNEMPLGRQGIAIWADDGQGGVIFDNFELLIKNDETRISLGLDWLTGLQNNEGGDHDGSWNGQSDCFVQNDAPVTITSFTLTNLCNSAHKNGMFPFDPMFEYNSQIVNGFDYLFGRAQSDGEGSGIYFTDPHPYNTYYSTAAVMTAISACRMPSYVINFPSNLVVHEKTFKQVMEEMVLFLQNSQEDNGGWDNDNYVVGYVAYGLICAERFGVEVSEELKTRLSSWIDYVQDDISWGGVRFDPDNPGPGEPNMINTAHILVEMALVGDIMTEDSRSQHAYDFLADHWCFTQNDQMWLDNYVELLYTIMKAFKLFDIDMSCTGEIDWFTDLVNHVYYSPQNYEQGWWQCAWGVSMELATCFALLTIDGDIPEYMNQAPVLSVDLAEIVVNEGETAVNSGLLSDSDGDIVTLISSIGNVINNGNETWLWNFPTTDGPANSQTVTISADDGNGGLSEVNFELYVNNISPVINEIIIPLEPVSIYEQPINVYALFTDPGSTYDAPYNCKFNFGDGKEDQEGTINDNTCIGQPHIYDTPGVYRITVMVTDKDDDTGTLTTTGYIVIYDPSEGFVTGGGWIDSPEGAYIPDPAMTGKANFGFVSKYKKGQTTPDGNTEFQFHTANMNFQSSLYDWLIIAGSKAMFKGEGTINGEGWYGFQLSAIDADLTSSAEIDKFRIKIWDMDENMVYDNLLGETLDEESPTAIKGGSIKIHKSNLKKATIDKDMDDFSASCYPNPFNDFTTIHFSLPKESNVLLKVFNVFGQEVKILLDTKLTQGIYEVKFDALDLVPGQYFYHIETSLHSVTNKMILIK